MMLVTGILRAARKGKHDCMNVFPVSAWISFAYGHFFRSQAQEAQTQQAEK